MRSLRYRRRPITAAYEVREPSPDLSEVSEPQWQLARERARLIRDLVDKPQRTRADVARVAAQLGVSVPRVYRLLRRHRHDPTVTGLLDRRRGPNAGDSRLRPEVDALIDQAIESTYLSKQRVRLADLVREVRMRCRSAGIPAPGRKAISIRLRRKPTELVVQRREGARAARDRFAPIKRSLESSGPLALVQIDHTLVDVIVVDSITRAPLQRPWLTVAIDVFTRCVAGFHLSLDAPSATSVALCLAHAALPKEEWLSSRGISVEWPISGLMKALHLDNGKEFHSEALQRGCDQHGIELCYRPVRTPHYGGHVERLIGTLMGKVHLLPGTTFSSVADKGAADPRKSATMTLAEVERWLGHAIAGVYHQTLHRGLSSTPLAAWKRSAAPVEDRRAVTDARQFFIDFLPLERRRVRREGVVLHNIAYWGDVLRSAVEEPDSFIIRYDPRDLSRIYWLGPDGIYYDLAYSDVRRPSISLWEHKAALRKIRADGSKEVDEDAIFEAIESMRTITGRADRLTKVHRRERERRMHQPSTAIPTPSVDSGGSGSDDPSEPDSLMTVEEWL